MITSRTLTTRRREEQRLEAVPLLSTQAAIKLVQHRQMTSHLIAHTCALSNYQLPVRAVSVFKLMLPVCKQLACLTCLKHDAALLCDLMNVDCLTKTNITQNTHSETMALQPKQREHLGLVVS